MSGAPSPGVRSSTPARGYILLMSHMRSHSSLLAHILGSHPEIDGYSELHLSYLGPTDLRAMTPLIEKATGRRRRGRYALDKVLHNDKVVDASILRRDDVRTIFLLRHPAGTIPSLMRITDNRVRADQAVGYYLARLEQLDRYSALAGHRAAFVEAERLVADAAVELGRLTRYLGLATPLEPTYERFPLSGVEGHGDFSPNILAGKVLRDDERDPGSVAPAEIPAETMEPALAAYDALRSAMLSRHPG